MIGICIPAHNEEAYIGKCLRSVMHAARHPLLNGEPVEIVVVLDTCSDETEMHARRWPVTCLHTALRNVGFARAAGARHLLAAGARWLAFTDADTVVSQSWLVDQLSLDSDVVCGTIDVSDWDEHGVYETLTRAFFLSYYKDEDGHRHVHGANLGIDAMAYQSVGGFESLACSEDREIVERLERAGASIAWTALPRVTTSARPFSRVAGGFATALRQAWPEDGQALFPDVPPSPT